MKEPAQEPAVEQPAESSNNDEAQEPQDEELVEISDDEAQEPQEEQRARFARSCPSLNHCLLQSEAE